MPSRRNRRNRRAEYPLATAETPPPDLAGAATTVPRTAWSGGAALCLRGSFFFCSLPCLAATPFYQVRRDVAHAGPFQTSSRRKNLSLVERATNVARSFTIAWGLTLPPSASSLFEGAGKWTFARGRRHDSGSICHCG